MRVALIAMSGVRAYNEELTKLGLTLPGFVERNKVIASLPSLGLLTLAALTPGDIEVEYIEVSDIRNFRILDNSFDLAAISTYSAQIFEAYELAKRLKESGVATVIGGPHVTSLPDEARSYCDSVVRGEGEPVWPVLISDLKNGRLKPLYSSFDHDFDLADSPVPRFELLSPGKYNRLTVQTSRGCPHKCEFCAASTTISPRYKQKPAAKVLTELKAIKKIWERPFIEFADDNTFVDKRYWKDLLKELKKLEIRWFTETDISVAQDHALLDLMRESGCLQVLIGLESPDAAGLEGLELTSNWKRKQLGIYKDAIKEIQAHGITVNGCFILGLDGHDNRIFDEVWEFVRESALYEVQITVMTAFPGTVLYDRLKADKRLINDGDWEKCTLFDVNFKPKLMSVQELEKGFRDLAEKIYSAEFTHLRRSRYMNALKERMKKENA